MTAARGRSARGVCGLSAKESIGAATATSATPHSEEFGGLRAVGTFEELGGKWQRGINLISTRRKYSWKSDEFGNIVRAKARLVARGFGQREGIHFFDTFSPCLSVMSVRLPAALACELDCHFDAEQALVQSNLDGVVYIRLSPGCGALCGKVVRLCRSLYGLNQASRTWHYLLVRGIKALGFEQCEADACVMRLVEDGAVDIACLFAC